MLRRLPAPRSTRARAMRGFSLVELLIGVAVLGILISAGLPSLSAWLQNSQIRTSAEGMQAGLQLARAEALRRNNTVRFALTDTLLASCALSTTGRSWVVSQADPTGACDVAPSDTTAPQIIQSKSSAEGTPNAVVTATGGSSVVFNGLGRVVTSGAPPITAIVISNTTAGACQGADGVGGGPMRCLRIQVSSGGQLRMCDPAVTAATDPRFCPVIF